MSVKHAALGAIRSFHRVLLSRDLPTKVAVYLHALEAGDHAAFREFVTYFKQAGYEFVGPAEFLNGAADRREVFLSFDDNFRSWFESLALFAQLQISVTFYVNALPFRDRASKEDVDRYFDLVCHTSDRTPLATEELRALADAGHVIGSHTYSHRLLTGMPIASAKEEISRGKEELEGVLGAPVLNFSFPFGLRRHFNERLREYCSEIGIQTVASARPIAHARQRPLRLNRLLWRLRQPLQYNLDNLRIDGRVFEGLTGRSPVGD